MPDPKADYFESAMTRSSIRWIVQWFRDQPVGYGTKIEVSGSSSNSRSIRKEKVYAHEHMARRITAPETTTPTSTSSDTLDGCNASALRE